jgi:hypothetical protein
VIETVEVIVTLNEEATTCVESYIALDTIPAYYIDTSVSSSYEFDLYFDIIPTDCADDKVL